MTKKTSAGLTLILCLLALVGCSQRPFMSQEQFQSYQRGVAISTVLDEMGRPDMVRAAKDGKGDEYIYIDRIDLNKDVTEHTHYIFRVVDGYVVEKDVQRFESMYPGIPVYR